MGSLFSSFSGFFSPSCSVVMAVAAGYRGYGGAVEKRRVCSVVFG